MQGAKLDVDDKHSRGRLGANDVAGELERIDGGITAHESDHGTLDRARKPAALDELEIEAGRREAGATSNQQMGDAVALRSKLQTIDRNLRQRWRKLFEPPHTRRGVREITARVETVGIDAIVFRLIAGR